MGRHKKWTDDQLIAAVANNSSFTGVVRALGLSPSGGGSHSAVKQRTKELNLDTSHMTGQGWCTGEKYQYLRDHNTSSLADVLVHDKSVRIGNVNLKRKLLREGLLQNLCDECGQGPVWNGKQLTLQLDHIDGDRYNNTLANLRLLCPNCHTQTNNWGGRNKKTAVSDQTLFDALQAHQTIAEALVHVGCALTRKSYDRARNVLEQRRGGTADTAG